MATKVKPCRIKATGTPQVGYVPKYVDEDTFQWGAGGGGGGSEIVYATQAEYNALLPGAASDGKHYFIYSTSGGGGWQPGANTVAYYPLDSTNTVNDLSGNGNTLTTNTGVVFGTYGGVDCAYSNKKYLKGPVTNLPVGNSARTTSIWLYGLWLQSDQSGYLCYGYNTTANRWAMITLNSGGHKVYLATSITDVMDGAFSTGQRYNIVATYDGTTAKLYVNGQLGNSATTTLNTSTTDLYIGIENDAVKPGEWYLSNVIIENVAWTDQEVSDYYDLTKGDYGIS